MFIVQDWFSIVPDIIIMCSVTVWSQIYCYLGKKKLVSDIKKKLQRRNNVTVGNGWCVSVFTTTDCCCNVENTNNFSRHPSQQHFFRFCFLQKTCGLVKKITFKETLWERNRICPFRPSFWWIDECSIKKTVKPSFHILHRDFKFWKTLKASSIEEGSCMPWWFIT